MAIKFSQFVLKTLPSELDFIVGYTGTENLQITPDHFLAPYLADYLPLAGGTMTGVAGVVAPDNFKWQFGNGPDLEIFHDAANSYINHVGTGNLYMQADGQIRLGSIICKILSKCTSRAFL